MLLMLPHRFTTFRCQSFCLQRKTQDVGFLCGMNKKSIIPRVSCATICNRVGLHDSFTTRVQVSRPLNAPTVASIALPLLALSVVRQTSTTDNVR